MDKILEVQSERVTMPGSTNSFEECCKPTEDEHVMSDNTNYFEECSKLTEERSDSLNPNRAGTNSEELVKINDRNETECNDSGTAAHDKKDTEKYDVMDLLVKLGNDTTVYNISNSLERVRYMINSISLEDILSSPILPHQRCVTYISEAQKTIKGNQKGKVFKFVSSYPSSYYRSRKCRVRTGVPVIIIGDVTNVQEDQCSYVFICAYMNEVTAVNGKAVKALGLLGTYSSSVDESNDSSDDGSSTVDSSGDSSSSDYSSSDGDKNNKKSNNKIVKKSEGFKPIAVDVRNPLVFLEDGAADKLPPVRECDMMVPKQDCIEIGYVMHIHELLVSVQGLKDSPALNADTLLFLEDNEDDKSLRSLGFIYEVIGPVGEPVYCITFKEEQNIEKKQVKQGAPVYIYPSPEHTRFVFVQDLLKQKGSDASWKNDVEPPEQFIEYSDDEEERLAKQRLKQASSKESLLNAAVKRNNTEDNNPEKACVYKRKKVIKNSVEVNEVGSGCIPIVGPRVHPGTAESQQNRIGARRKKGRGRQMPHMVQVNGETGNRRMPSMVPPGTSDNQHNGIGSYCAPGRGQRILRAVQVNGEVGNRSMPSIVPPGTSDNGIGSYCAAGRGQRMLRAVQVNNMEPPRVQPPGLVAVHQPPPRMQQYTHVPAVNKQFLPVPPAFRSNQRLTPPLQQQQAYFNSPSYPRHTSPFPPPQGQPYNPHQ